VLDAIVVGAGPSGTSAAYHLARGGAEVALVDRQEPPRHRVQFAPGALSPLAQECLAGMGLAPWASRYEHCTEARFFGPRGSEAEVWFGEGHRAALLVPSADLDRALVDTAASAGAELFLGVTVRQVVIENDHVRLQASEELPPARLLILAEGSAARLADSLGLVHAKPAFVALWGCFARDVTGGLVELHFLSEVLPCVSWVTAYGKGVAGVGVSASARQVAGGDLDMLAIWRHFGEERACGGGLSDIDRCREPEMARIRVGLGSVTPYTHRVLVTGSAAGVVHPLTFQGIGIAMESGRIVTQHALYALEKGRFSASDLSAYAGALRRRFGIEFRAARILRAWLHSERVLERIIGRAQRDPGFASLIANLFLGAQSTVGALTPAGIARYLVWWCGPRRRG